LLASLRHVDRIDVDHIKVALATDYPTPVLVGGSYVVGAPAGAYLVVAGVAVDPVVAEAAVVDETKPKEASFTP